MVNGAATNGRGPSVNKRHWNIAANKNQPCRMTATKFMSASNPRGRVRGREWPEAGAKANTMPLMLGALLVSGVTGPLLFQKSVGPAATSLWLLYPPPNAPALTRKPAPSSFQPRTLAPTSPPGAPIVSSSDAVIFTSQSNIYVYRPAPLKMWPKLLHY